jgi:hypothetical protein
MNRNSRREFIKQAALGAATRKTKIGHRGTETQREAGTFGKMRIE